MFQQYKMYEACTGRFTVNRDNMMPREVIEGVEYTVKDCEEEVANGRERKDSSENKEVTNLIGQ